MKNLFIASTVLMTVWYANAQTEPNIIKPEAGQTEYIVSGDTTLVASDFIRLLPNSHIQSGSNFHAYIVESPYEPPVIATGLNGENYIYTRNYQKGMKDADDITSNSDVIEQITYFDGLGRPMQNIAIKASPNLKDIVTHMEYDDYGRMAQEFLPYEADGVLGSLRTDNQILATQNFYKGLYPDDFSGIPSANTNPYSEKEFEYSPLNRVLKQAAPGEDWKLGNGHEIKFNYSANEQDEVRRFVVTLTVTNYSSNPNDTNILYVPNLISNGFYLEGELFKNVTKDENWAENQSNPNDHTTEEFTDKQGRVLLKRSYNEDIPHDTYYVYDDYGNLTYVLPPKMNGGTANMDELGYQYVYDHRNRLVEKKIPGKGWEQIVYSRLDQPVMTQDPNLDSQNDWLFTKYDTFGRVAYTGFSHEASSRDALQSAANILFPAVYETKKNTPTDINGIDVYYTAAAIPAQNHLSVLSVNYYDDYNFDRDGIAKPDGPIMGQDVSNKVQGLPTVSKVKVLEENVWITTLTAYDKKGRAIYTKTVNPYLGTTDIIETKLDFAGKVLDTRTTHTKGSTSIVVNDAFEYDHMVRLKSQKQQINGQAQEMLFSNNFDGIGQLVKKDVGNTKVNPLQEVDYKYNVRGWLKNINNPETLNDDLFGFGIFYNSGGSQNYTYLYNGNIKATQWQTANPIMSNDIAVKQYDYSYDALNRLKSGTRNSGIYSFGSAYSEVVDYDKNGNIVELHRVGENQYQQIDNLAYTYQANSNRLNSVTDSALSNDNATRGFVDKNTEGNDYAYDTNGNMVKDLNKGIGSSTANGITYNHLNLPTEVIIDDGDTNNGTISYIYDATGVKLQKNVLIDGVNSPTDYAGNYIYENGNLKQFSHAEGYVEVNANVDYDYVYSYLDHLGTVRLTYSDFNGNGSIEPDTEILQERNTYPFGLEHKGYNNVQNGTESNYQTYLGQEMNKELGLNWLTFRYRNYDATIGRFFGVDPIAEQFPNQTPYQFASNNPIWKIELEGLEGLPTTEEDYINGLTYGVDTGDGTSYVPRPNGPIKQALNDATMAVHNTLGSILGAIHEGLSSGIESGVRTVMGTLEPDNTVSDSEFNDAVSSGDESTFYAGLEDEAATMYNAIPGIAGEAGAMVIEGGAMEIIGAGLNAKSNGPGLGNQFKNKSVNQVNKAMNKHVKSGKLEAKYTDPVSGSKSYKNTESGYSYNVDTGKSGKTGTQREPAHVDVNYPNPKPRNVPSKKKLPINQ